MISRFSRHLATILACTIGVLGVLGVLYAWRLPPFETTIRTTEDAYVRGQVTFIAPQLAGVVAEVAVQDYQRVKAGDLLVRIDEDSYREKVAQAQAALDAAEASLANSDQDRKSAEASVKAAEAGVVSAKASLKLANANLDRSNALKKRGVLSNQNADETQLSYEQAQAAVQQAAANAETARQSLASVITGRTSLEANVRQAEATVKLAQISLDYTRIVAPVDGRLGEVSAHVGQYVTAGTKLTSLVPDTIWIVANFKETQLAGMNIGQKVTFTVDALGKAELTGKIASFSPATGSEFSVLGSSNATGNFIKISQRLPVRINIDTDQALAARLVPGMSVVASVDTGRTEREATEEHSDVGFGLGAHDQLAALK
jgi:multidrug resistance efflux pump